MVVIRLAYGGSKKRPFYRVVVADKRAPRDGRFIEKVGFYNPLARGQETSLDIQANRYEHWVSQGAQPSPRVASLFKLFEKNGRKSLPARFEKIVKTPMDKPKAIATQPVAKEIGSENTETTVEEVTAEE